MGLFKFEAGEETPGSSWLLESFKRQFSPTSNNHFQFNSSSSSLSIKQEPGACTRDEYFVKLCHQIRRMLDGGGEITRMLNKNSTQVITFPAITPGLLSRVPQDVMNIYWDLNQHAYFLKQIAMNNYLQIEQHRFLTNPSTELKQFFQNDSPKPRTNNDASRRSRIKKRINTELILESYECDKAESALLDEEEQQLHLIIGVLEDMVYEQSGNVRLINYYRDLSCLS